MGEGLPRELDEPGGEGPVGWVGGTGAEGGEGSGA
jgi:hypothetical protein